MALKLTQQSYTFCFLSFLLVSFAGNLARLQFEGKSFRKAFRILGFDERKGRWVVKQDFHGNFLGLKVTCTWFFSSGVLNQMVLILVCLQDLFTLHKLADKDVLAP